MKELIEDYFNSKGSDDSILNPTIRSKIIFGVAAIMKKLHKLNIVHSNLTIGNILLDDNYEPLINNFGFAGVNKGGPFDEVPILIDKPFYEDFVLSFAPERIESGESMPESDVFSYGMFLYLMFYPLKKMMRDNRIKNLGDICQNALRGNRFLRPPIIPDHYWKLIQHCWNQSPDERQSFEEITQLLRDDRFALNEFGDPTDLDQLHEYQNRIEKI